MDSGHPQQRLWPTPPVQPLNAGSPTPIVELDSTSAPDSPEQRAAPGAVANVWTSQQPVERVIITTSGLVVRAYFIPVGPASAAPRTGAERPADGIPLADLAQVQSREPRKYLATSTTITIMLAQPNVNQLDLHAGPARLEPNGPTKRSYDPGLL